jgi:hypothetical protein
MSGPPWRQAWNEYRGWAKYARDEQASTWRWNVCALVCTVLASFFGAAAAVSPAGRLFPTQILAGIAAAVAAVGAVLGRQILAAGSEEKWIQARATAEGLKSECFRFAAKAGVYSGDNASNAFMDRRDELQLQSTAKGLISGNDPVPEGEKDNREPPCPLAKDWYKTERIQDQIKYYRCKSDDNVKWTKRIGWVGFGAALVAAVLGAIGIAAQAWAPWIGTMTTVAAAVTAFGLLDRRRYLAASYSAMKSSLERILERDENNAMDLAKLVTATEDLLDSEHKAWLDQMLSKRAGPNVPAAATEKNSTNN